jgi:hypothetical protein
MIWDIPNFLRTMLSTVATERVKNMTNNRFSMGAL